jgi:hypothetical protein
VDWEGGKPGRPFLKILSAWVNMNQSQYAVTATMMAENTNLAKRSCFIDKRYRGIVKPQLNPRLNLTDQGYCDQGWRKPKGSTSHAGGDKTRYSFESALTALTLDTAHVAF